MQALPSQSQRQLVSGKIGWGWRQATYPISVNFGFAGFLILTMAIAQLFRINEPFNQTFIWAIASILLITGLGVGIYTARSVVEVCRQNADYLFSRSQLITIAAYWLVLIAGLSISSEVFAKTVVALWWILPAAIFIGISGSLTWRSRQIKARQYQIPESVTADVLNIITYSDQTVLVSPSAIGQQPRQFNSLVLVLLGFFFWTMLDFSSNVRAITAITLTSAGLTGFFTWQAQLRSPEKMLYLKFSGLWGIAAEYTISLRPFSSLSIVKLEEAGGELSWMQLSGSNSEITIPLAMTTNIQTNQANQASNTENNIQEDQFAQTIREEFCLAKQESERDSLGLANVLLPQGAAILAGSSFIILGALLLFIFPLPAKLLTSSVSAWLGVCLVSPAIARFFLQLVAPNSLQSDHHSNFKNHLQPWEIGTAILLVSGFVLVPSTVKTISLGAFSQAFPIITLICGWLSISIGICILAFVRRTPLWHNNR